MEKRRNHDTGFKARVALEALKGERVHPRSSAWFQLVPPPSNTRTRQQTRQFSICPNAESPARAGLCVWNCWYKVWLRGHTATVICHGRSVLCEGLQ